MKKRRKTHAAGESDPPGDARPSGNRNEPYLQGQPVPGNLQRKGRAQPKVASVTLQRPEREKLH